MVHIFENMFLFGGQGIFGSLAMKEGTRTPKGCQDLKGDDIKKVVTKRWTFFVYSLYNELDRDINNMTDKEDETEPFGAQEVQNAC